MKPIKKVEIIADSIEMRKIVEILDKLGINGYTMIGGVSGRGDRGSKDDQGLTGVFHNTYLMLACPDKQAHGLVEAVRPLLKNVGGICLVSDAQWVIH